MFIDKQIRRYEVKGFKVDLRFFFRMRFRDAENDLLLTVLN